MDANTLHDQRLKHPARKGKRASEYRTWEAMKARCLNKNNSEYHRYGAIGVTVCQEWIASFSAFLLAVGPKPTSQHSIDRYPDKTGNYEPGNVRWATKTEQARNRRTSRLITVDGITKTLAEWSELSGLHAATIRDRIDDGWDAKLAVTIPAAQRGRRMFYRGAPCRHNTVKKNST